MAGADKREWLFWLGLTIGIAGFCWGAAKNPAALAVMWTQESGISLAVLAVAATLASAGQRFSRRPALFSLSLGCAVVLAAFGIVACVTVALLLLTSFAVGARLLRWTVGDSDTSACSNVLSVNAVGVPLRSDVFSSTAIGLSACSLLLGFMAHWPVNVTIVYLALSAVALACGWRDVQRAWEKFLAAKPINGQAPTPHILLAALWFAFALHVAFAAVPERYYDALAMHLLIARAMELFGLWHFDASEYSWAVQPMGANWLFGWAYVLAGEQAAKLLNAVFLLVISGILAESGLVTRRQALVVIAILALTPLTFVVSASLFVDNALALFTVAAIVFAARIRETPSPGQIAGFAIASAGAIAVKLQGVIAFGCVCVALVLFGGWRELYRSSGRTKFICLVALLAGFWPYAYAWIATGNPVFPHFNGVFKSPLFPQENFTMPIYPGGLSITDFFDLTFSSEKYLEGRDGAAGFALPFLLPAGLLLIFIGGSRAMKFVAFATLAYVVCILINIRYLRYLFPVYPLVALVLVYPLRVMKGTYARAAVLLVAFIGAGWGILRIPAAGWILSRVDLSTTFSTAEQERVMAYDAPLRTLGRVQAALGDNESRVVIFGQPVGADIRGRPLYTNWYYPKLQGLVLTPTSPEEAAAALAGQRATHVLFDNRSVPSTWNAWHDAVQKFGRLIAQTPVAELYEFDSKEALAVDVLAGTSGTWQDWLITSPHEKQVTGNSVAVPAGATISRPVDIPAVAAGALVTLSVDHVCASGDNGLIQAQINFLREDGVITYTTATRSRCGPSATSATVSATKPSDTRTAYFYLINSGAADARLYNERVRATVSR